MLHDQLLQLPGPRGSPQAPHADTGPAMRGDDDGALTAKTDNCLSS
jgi:hypothetical protein